MKQGPTKIVSCPHCKSYNLKNTYLSWNNFGIELWSDFRFFGSGMPEIHDLIKCHHCSQLFWIEEQEEIGNYSKDDKNYRSAGFPLVPEMEDYVKALQ